MEIDPNLGARHRRGRAGLALLAFALALAGAASACGEDVDFSSGKTQDAGAPAASDASTVSDAAPETSVTDGNARDVGARDGACFADDDAAMVCRPNGTLCRSTNDCCSGRCEDGYCLKLGTCAAPGAPCSTRSSCCSERCEPTGRNGALECSQYCLADGARCAARRPIAAASRVQRRDLRRRASAASSGGCARTTASVARVDATAIVAPSCSPAACRPAKAAASMQAPQVR